MCTVPRQEILHPVDTRQSKVERILICLCRERLCGDKQRSERNRCIRHVQEGEPFEHGEAALGSVWVARACLSHDHLGGKELVMCPLLVPPHHGELLVSGHQQIPARPCCEITHNARFDIDRWFCVPCV